MFYNHYFTRNICQIKSFLLGYEIARMIYIFHPPPFDWTGTALKTLSKLLAPDINMSLSLFALNAVVDVVNTIARYFKSPTNLRGKGNR